MPAGHAGRQLGLDLGNGLADALHDVERVRRREHEDADEHGGLAVEADFLVVGLGAEDDVGDIAEANHDAVLFLDHDLLELVGGLEVRVGDEVHRGHRSLRPSQRGEVVVLGQRVVYLRRRDAQRRHLVAESARPASRTCGRRRYPPAARR